MHRIVHLKSCFFYLLFPYIGMKILMKLQERTFTAMVVKIISCTLFRTASMIVVLHSYFILSFAISLMYLSYCRIEDTLDNDPQGVKKKKRRLVLSDKLEEEIRGLHEKYVYFDTGFCLS